MIRFEDVTFSYSGGASAALSSVSLSVEAGERVALVGANGSGKSTLVRLANGLSWPSAGRVEVDGFDTRDTARAFELRSMVGVVFQHADDQIVATAVEDDVAFGPENLGLPREEIRHRVDQAIAAVGLTGLERREPHLLSGGQKQRLAIAGALAMRPRYLLLDEPTSMIDPVGRDEVLDVLERLAAEGHAVVHITHDLAEASHADRAVVLAAGRIVFDGTPHELLTGPSLGEWGLAVPPIAALASALADHGVDITPGPLQPDRLVESLCR